MTVTVRKFKFVSEGDDKEYSLRELINADWSDEEIELIAQLELNGQMEFSNAPLPPIRVERIR